jgi:cobalamin synthase
MAFSIGNSIIICFGTYYIMMVLRLLFSKNLRTQLKKKNKKMDSMREKNAILTLEQQKKFTALKYPKSKKLRFRITFRGVLNFLIYSVVFMLIAYLINKVFTLAQINLNIVSAILFIIAFPLIMNWLLKRFGLNQGDSLGNYVRLNNEKKK